MTLLIAVGCVRAQPAQNASGPDEWPSYWAQDYENPGHPTLTRSEVALIRKTLALLKPCQAAQLRYAFPRGYPAIHKMVLFFWSRDPSMQPHVLWSYNGYYTPSEGVEVSDPWSGKGVPTDLGGAYEVQHHDCT
jgi:hypothetical protein